MNDTMRKLTKHTDLLAAGAVVLVVVMMIVMTMPAMASPLTNLDAPSMAP